MKSIPAHAALTALMALMPTPTRSALCDDTFNLQGAAQTLFSGTDPKNLARTSKVLKADLSDMDFIHDQMAYSILTGFEGSCTKAVKPVRFLERVGQATSLSPRTASDFQVVMYDSNSILEGSSFQYWFGFYKPADTLQMALGRVRSAAGDFRGWYGFVTFEDSVRNPESGLWTAKGTRLRMAGPADSAALDSALMIASGFRDLVFDGNRRGHFKLQFIRVSLENKPGTAVRPRAWANHGAAPGFRMDQALYLIDGKRIGAGLTREAFGSRRYPAGRP